MSPSEGHLIQLAKHIGTIGLQAANAYNAVQASLQLELILTFDRLATSEGTSTSLATLAKLSDLNNTHKEAYAKFVTAAVSQLTTALAELPELQAIEHRDGMVKSANWNFAAQARFYVQRDEWIEKAVAICELVESRRSYVTFNVDTISFSKDDDLAMFQALVSRVDEIHELEVVEAAERMTRLAKSITILGSHSG